MFVAQSKKGSAIFNGLILFVVVAAAVTVVLALTKIKSTGDGNFRHTLDLKKGD